MKTCNGCGLSKPIGEFRRDARRKGGFGSRCKPCVANQTRNFLRRHKAEHGERYEMRYAVDVTCADCGKAYRTTNPGTIRCRSCSANRALAAKMARVPARREARRLRRLPVHVGPPAPYFAFPARYLARLAPPKRSTWWKLIVAGDCPVCGTYFVARAASLDTASRYCSEVCRRRSGHDRRRALKRDAYVDDVSPHAIFERDRWTCQICGKRVARTKTVPHPKAPTIDHVIPLSAGHDAGGVHAPYNAQCAHFLCNSTKGARLAQPALF